MSCCKYECTCLSVIISIIIGFIIGILNFFDIVATGVIFWVFLAIGVAAVLLLPVYALTKCSEGDKCFCCYRKLLTAASVGTIITAGIGLIIESVIGGITLAIVVGFATFFAVLLITSVICFAKCLCKY